MEETQMLCATQVLDDSDPEDTDQPKQVAGQ